MIQKAEKFKLLRVFVVLLDDSDLTFLGDHNVTIFFDELKTTVIRRIYLCSDLMWHNNSSTVFKHNYEVFFTLLQFLYFLLADILYFYSTTS